jgi:DUF4097 and DUF4098 domain-containing protein YvlB
MRGAAVILTAACVLSTGCQSWKFSARRTQQLAAPLPLERLVVDSSNGNIEIRAADVQEVQIEAALKVYGATEEDAARRLDQTTVQLEQRDGELRVYAEKPSPFMGSISYTITAPATLAVRLDTSNGKLTTSGLAGGQELETSNGTITVRAARGPLVADTSNGTIDLEAFEPVRVEASSSNGKITFRGALQGNDNQLETSNGTITVGLWGPPVNVSAKTSNGRITLDGQRLGKSAEVTVGSGDSPPAQLRLKTSNGRISMESLNPPETSGAQAPSTATESAESAEAVAE